MSNQGQDVQAIYQQYQTALRQMQFYEQQEAIVANQIEQYKSNLVTLLGLKENSNDEDFIFPLSDMLLIKGRFSEVKEVLVDVGSEYYLPSTYEEAEKRIQEKLAGVQEFLGRVTQEKSQLQTMTSQLQAQISRLSQS